MAMSLDELEAMYPTDQEQVEGAKASMVARSRAFRLRELRTAAGLTQEELAKRIGVGTRQVSKIESGDLETTQLGTLRKYLLALPDAEELVVGIEASRGSFIRVA